MEHQEMDVFNKLYFVFSFYIDLFKVDILRSCFAIQATTI